MLNSVGLKDFWTLNFACFVACFRFPETGPEVLIVYHNESSGTYSVRLPGGCCKFIDIVYGINQIMPQMSPVESDRMPGVIERIHELGVDYEEGVTKLKLKLKEDVSENEKSNLEKSKKDLALRKLKKEHFFSKNYLFNLKMRDAYQLINYALLNKSLVGLIIDSAHIACAERELVFETSASIGATFYEASSSLVGTHEKVCMVSFDLKAPDSYSGSADSEIAGSEWMSLEDAEKQLFEATMSSHKVFFQAAINRAITLKLPNSEQLQPYLTATDS
ncbi:MAG: hypothetical protein KBD48_03645 [Candidatus Pacebacteria bacterium]|nr:hypothetical protein [Candidatus Paceibacterota bacterium]MBP9716250.1 hypothetical protein [Candidatus Paceibacterota bacterium]